ncbi:hypothetical protein O0L34_g4373 [Tuta absoluta]|nr:hypothetical protein O0L34_g4373 [Tuta absoluta]
MSYLTAAVWRKLTAKAVEQSTGKLEADFFESVYRITYAAGIEDCRQVYNDLAKSMESPTFDISTPARERIFLYWKNMNDKYYKVLLFLATFTLMVWYFYPLMDDEDYNLVVALHVPFDYQTPHRYAVVYAVTVTFFHFISYFVVVNDLMMQTYLLHMVCQFAVLRDGFEKILVDCGVDINGEIFKHRYLNRLGLLVKQHNFILNNATKLRTILSKPMLGQLAASCVLICLAGYQVTATVTDSIPNFLRSIMYLSYNLYGFYILCRWCDEIKMQSEKICEAVYFSGWERGVSIVPGVRARIMLVVARASKPLVLTAGGLCDVSLMSYTTLVKTSYSALTVLLRTRQH